jgi:hypothetical protein
MLARLETEAGEHVTGENLLEVFARSCSLTKLLLEPLRPGF